MDRDDEFDEILETLVPTEDPRSRSMKWAGAIVAGAVGLVALTLLGYALGGVTW